MGFPRQESWCWLPNPPLGDHVSQSLLKFMFIELVMLSNHLILCRPLLLCQSFTAESPGSPVTAAGSILLYV